MLESLNKALEALDKAIDAEDYPAAARLYRQPVRTADGVMKPLEAWTSSDYAKAGHARARGMFAGPDFLVVSIETAADLARFAGCTNTDQVRLLFQALGRLSDADLEAIGVAIAGGNA